MGCTSQFCCEDGTKVPAGFRPFRSARFQLRFSVISSARRIVTVRKVSNPEEAMMNTDVRNEVKVWDPLLRIFHWTLVISFAVDYVSGEEALQLHVWFGYLIAGLLVFRIPWGFIGPKYARFSDFVYSPREIGAYLKSLMAGSPKRYLGHNPAGGAMVVLLLVSLVLTTGSGLILQQTSDDAPPLPSERMSLQYDDDDHEEEHGAFSASEAMEEVHEFFANLTLLLVLIHMAGVLVSSRLHREPLVRAMITGKKPADPPAE
jgi:cytochrome b